MGQCRRAKRADARRGQHLKSYNGHHALLANAKKLRQVLHAHPVTTPEHLDVGETSAVADIVKKKMKGGKRLAQ